MKQIILSAALLAGALVTPSFAADPPAAANSAATASGASAAATVAPTATSSTSAPTAAAATAAKPAPAAAKPAAVAPAATTDVQVVTSMGNFIIELNAERAPLTVAQFLKYVDQGFYSGTIFHRSISNFVIQGGGYDPDYKLKGNPSKVFNESGNGLTNQRGTVGLARPPEPHAGDVQFYVNLNDNSALDPNQARWGYAVFGKVVQGMDVVDRIGNVATGARGPFKENAPLQPVLIERIERVAPP